jgi:SpoVK/Ycf46/Vps4 family AAA+-type ATPase
VLSKYIGETEMDQRRVYDAAQGGGAILLFDEADAVFGKRSQVNDSDDPYAHNHVNYRGGSPCAYPQKKGDRIPPGSNGLVGPFPRWRRRLRGTVGRGGGEAVFPPGA